MNPEDLIEALAKLQEEKTKEAEKTKAQFELAIRRLSSPISRYTSSQAPFQVGYDIDKIFEHCKYIIRNWSAEIKQDLYFCRYTEHVDSYRNSGCILLSCENCRVKIDHDKIADFDSLIHSISTVIEGR